MDKNFPRRKNPCRWFKISFHERLLSEKGPGIDE